MQSGIYRLTRNPMYLGLLVILLGWAIFLANVLAFLLLPAFIVYMNRFQIEPEERALASLFGQEFTCVCLIGAPMAMSHDKVNERRSAF